MDQQLVVLSLFCIIHCVSSMECHYPGLVTPKTIIKTMEQDYLCEVATIEPEINQNETIFCSCYEEMSLEKPTECFCGSNYSVVNCTVKTNSRSDFPGSISVKLIETFMIYTLSDNPSLQYAFLLRKKNGTEGIVLPNWTITALESNLLNYSNNEIIPREIALWKMYIDCQFQISTYNDRSTNNCTDGNFEKYKVEYFVTMVFMSAVVSWVLVGIIINCFTLSRLRKFSSERNSSYWWGCFNHALTLSVACDFFLRNSLELDEQIFTILTNNAEKANKEPNGSLIGSRISYDYAYFRGYLTPKRISTNKF